MSIYRRQRQALQSYLSENTNYDVRTMRIAANGDVSARKDADKTLNGPETVRYFVGNAADLLNDRRAKLLAAIQAKHGWEG